MMCNLCSHNHLTLGSFKNDIQYMYLRNATVCKLVGGNAAQTKWVDVTHLLNTHNDNEGFSQRVQLSHAKPVLEPRPSI